MRSGDYDDAITDYGNYHRQPVSRFYPWLLMCCLTNDKRFFHVNTNGWRSPAALLALAFGASPASTYAQWWNPFGPKTYDECVLDKIKDVHGQEAVAALQAACMDKFPPQESAEEKAAAEKYNERLKRCGLAPDYWKTHLIMSIEAHPAQTLELLNNLTKRARPNADTIYFQNNNNFGVSGVQIGFINNRKECPSTLKEYEATTYCAAYSGQTTEGVPSKSYGWLHCGAAPPEAATMQFCLIGISPTYDRLTNDLPDWLERNGYCK